MQNTGLGYEGALSLLQQGAARVILAVRSVERGEAAAVKMRAAVPDAKGVVDVWELDLASFASVKEFAARANNELERLDSVVENAGVAPMGFSPTGDGWELM